MSASNGYDLGGAAPYGYRRGGPGGTFEPHPDEQRVLAIARAWRREGASLRRIAAGLAENGYYARNGNVFQATQIMRMCVDE